MIDPYGLATALLRGVDPERAHEAAIAGLQAGLGPVQRRPDPPSLRTRLCGLDLANPIGLAAGFDKDARAPMALLRAGFGFVECGTVTPLPQPGNPRPRLFRLKEDRAVINRFGFNSQGLEPFAARLAALPAQRPGPVFANLGANKESADRIGDYVVGLQQLWGLADGFTVNVSSPNTPGLRALQTRAALDELGGRVAEARAVLRRAGETRGDPPVFLKVAPDLQDAEVEAIVGSAGANGFDGLVVSNTTIERPAALRSPHAGETGGLSGRPLFEKSTRLLGLFSQAAQGTGLTLIGVGGVASGADALAKLRAGAAAVQLYTALAYEGPGLVQRIKREMLDLLRAEAKG
jgi:dihydroorotate dehydrogenase